MRYKGATRSLETRSVAPTELSLSVLDRTRGREAVAIPDSRRCVRGARAPVLIAHPLRAPLLDPQVDNQLPSALFPALLRPRPLPGPKRLPDGTKAPVGLIQLDGLAPRPADR